MFGPTLQQADRQTGWQHPMAPYACCRVQRPWPWPNVIRRNSRRSGARPLYGRFDGGAARLAGRGGVSASTSPSAHLRFSVACDAFRHRSGRATNLKAQNSWVWLFDGPRGSAIGSNLVEADPPGACFAGEEDIPAPLCTLK